MRKTHGKWREREDKSEMKFSLTCLKSNPFLVLEDQFVGGVEERKQKEKEKRKKKRKSENKRKCQKKKKRETKSACERERERIEEVSFSLPFTSFRRSKLDRPGVKIALRDESSM